jgi:WD40 repeat protein
VLSVDFSPDATRVVSGSKGKLVKIWVAETRAEVSSFERVRSLWSGDGGGFMLALGAAFAWEVV